MAYANQFVASIVYKNQPQREFNKDGIRTVQLPFDSEYAIRVQNKTFYKAAVDVLIDGVSIFSSGKRLILDPSQTVNLERFVNDMNAGSKFKFVSLQKAVSEGHQDPTSLDFGVVSIVFTPQKTPSLFDSITTISSGGNISIRGGNTLFNNNFVGVAVPNKLTSCYASACTNSFSDVNFHHAINNNTPLSQVGGTVEGSESKQKFQESNEYLVWDNSKATTIRMKLVGEVKEISPFPKDVVLDGKRLSYQWVNKNPDGTVVVCYK